MSQQKVHCSGGPEICSRVLERILDGSYHLLVLQCPAVQNGANNNHSMGQKRIR